MLAKVIIENGVKKIQALTADTGTGAPVGSVIVICSNILPSGYLGLGVHYDITNYPALYQVLGTDTTPTASALGLPTLSSGQYAIKATSGLTENQQENVLNTINENLSYSTTEHPTGKKWIDGKPTYEKTFYGTSLPSNQIIGHIDNIDNVIKKEGFIKNANDGNFLPLNYAGSINNYVASNGDVKLYSNNYSATKYNVTIEYTKTTD